MAHRPEVKHVLPLCTSAVTLGLSVLQYPLFLAFLNARPSIAGRPLSTFWDAFLPSGAGVIVSINLVSAVAGALSARAMGNRPGSSWYGYGALMALSHLAFMPVVAGPIRRMIEGKDSVIVDKDIDRRVDWEKEQAVEELNRLEQGKWLKIHTLRTVTVDLVAVFCFAKGFGSGFM